MNNEDAIERFRRIALALPGAMEGSHFGAVDFRVNNHIFVTLAYAARGVGTLKLTSQQQAECVADAPGIFQAVQGGWGRMGMTLIRLDAPEDVLTASIALAYRNVADKHAAKARSRKRSTGA